MSLEWFPIVPEIRDASQNAISGLIELGLLPSGWSEVVHSFHARCGG